MSKKHLDERGKQKGAQAHAEGAHGDKTHRRRLQELRSGPSGDAPRSRDETEQNSEENRLDRGIREHGHPRDDFQVRDGAI